MSDHRIGDNLGGLSFDSPNNKNKNDGVFGEELKRIQGILDTDSIEDVDALSDNQRGKGNYIPKTIEEKLILELSIKINNIIAHSNFLNPDGFRDVNLSLGN